jgi:alpha-beta hydrolase superfamily lysophospholipase
MKNESYFTTRDNHRLYCETWAPESPKAVLIFVHGLNEHIGRYAHVAHFFSDEYTCHLYDQRGHGRSEGVRAFAESFGNFSADLDEFVNKVKTESGPLKIFIVGHSMGGQVVLNYLGQYSSANLSGFITS